MDAHDCQYKLEVEELKAVVATLEAKLDLVQSGQAAEIAQLKKALFGARSERMPAPSEILRSEVPADPAKTAQRRRENAKAREDACVEEHEERSVPASERVCPECGGEAQPISKATTSTVVEFVSAHFRRRVIHRETVACSCGSHVVTAPAPQRVLGQSKYSGSFVAHLVVSKLLDSLPVYRMEKRFKRMGIPMARSTMNDLVLKAGFELTSLHERLLALIAEQPVVQADETTLPVQAKVKCKKGFVWTFSARLQLGGEDDDDPVLVAYRYSKGRSGKTPSEILAGTNGVLVVDAFTGYNAVTDDDGRTRAGCLAHIRRKFFDARSDHEGDADEALALILDVYRVEHEAMDVGIVRSEEHATLRNTKARAAMDALHAWLLAKEPCYPPRSSGLGRAIRHALTNWERLTVFLDDVNVPVDNNASERALRPVAKGRDNWMFAGNDDAAARLMALLGLCATCEANGINPELYLADVLGRLDSHPANRIDELLPHRWSPAGR